MTGLSDEDREDMCVDGSCSHYGVGTHSTYCNDHAEAVEAIKRRAVNEALTEAADAIEALADRGMSTTSRSFHPAGTHSDGRRDGCWEGRMDAARIVRARTT